MVDVSVLPKCYQSCFRILDRTIESYFKSIPLASSDPEKVKNRKAMVFVLGNNLTLFLDMDAVGTIKKSYEEHGLDLLSKFSEWIQEKKSELVKILEENNARKKEVDPRSK